jgi:uncharacterized repeat protein (TIGR01451 family)
MSTFKNTLTLPRRPVAMACAAVAIAGSMAAFAPALYAATAAGVQIRNTATVTYEDAAGNPYSAVSNEAVVTVAQVFTATLGTDNDKTASAGQTVYLPYVLTNAGNGPDVFDLSASNGITGGDDLDSSAITLYRDTNGSGEPDAGEPVVSQLNLAAGEIANLVVGVEVPVTATSGQTIGVTLDATAQNGTGAAVAVTDLSAGAGRDTQDGTNESLITVTSDAVLVTTKSSIHDQANNQITYTVSVINNGSRAARDVVLFDGLPAGTSLVSSSVSGILASNGDTVNTLSTLDDTSVGVDLNADGDLSDSDEASLGLDLNNDGDQSDSGIQGVYAIDSELPPLTSVSLTITVSYDPALFGGGSTILNQGHVSGDTDGDAGNAPDSLVSSNITADVVGSRFSVALSDTGANNASGVNDGGDDDTVINDDQFVDIGSAGGQVMFALDVTNTGNQADAFTFNAAAGNFPAGTIFSFFDESGLVLLTDSGSLGAGESRRITVKATLPSDAVAPATEYEAIVTASSANDPAASPASDPVTLSLGDIAASSADIHAATNGTLQANEDALGAAPYAAVNTIEAEAGDVLTLPVYIDNESGVADSFVLRAGSDWDGAVLGALAPGWTVQFFESDGAGAPTGSAITSSPVIPANSTDFELIAVINVPSGVAQAVGDATYDNDADGTPDTLDSNIDGDGDYPIFFQIESNNTGASDIMLDAVDVDPARDVQLVTPGSNQLEPGGRVDYGHTLSNNGNVTETVELSYSNAQADFSSTLTIDTNGDGVADTEVGGLALNSTITVRQADGINVTVLVTDSDNDGLREFELSSGVELPLLVTVFAPTTAAPGTIDTFTLTATNTDINPVAPDASVSDVTTVINGQVRLSKTVAIDTECDGIADTAFAPIQTTSVAPGECAIWQVVAENQGSADALNVKIADAVTSFSTYQPESMEYCLSAGCSLSDMSDTSGDDNGTLTGNNITFFVGADADAATDTGGTLVPGQQATARFSVQVD